MTPSRRVLPVVALLPALTGCSVITAHLPGASKSPTPEGYSSLSVAGRPAGCVAVLASTEAQHKGLSGAGIPGVSGAAFVFSTVTTTTAFWMMDTPTPLTVAFVSPAGAALSVQPMAPYSPVNHVSPVPYAWALEVPTAAVGRLGLSSGVPVALGAPCRPGGS